MNPFPSTEQESSEAALPAPVAAAPALAAAPGRPSVGIEHEHEHEHEHEGRGAAAASGYLNDATPDTPEGIRESIINGYRAIYDPEIPVNIWDLGLIYDIAIADDRTVAVKMTLTSPMCPTAQSLVSQVELATREAAHVKDATVDLVWEPPWSMETMSEEARLLLGF